MLRRKLWELRECSRRLKSRLASVSIWIYRMGLLAAHTTSLARRPASKPRRLKINKFSCQILWAVACWPVIMRRKKQSLRWRMAIAAYKSLSYLAVISVVEARLMADGNITAVEIRFVKVCECLLASITFRGFNCRRVQRQGQSLKPI